MNAQSKETKLGDSVKLVSEIKPSPVLILWGSRVGLQDGSRNFNMTADVYCDTGWDPLKSAVCKSSRINTQSVLIAGRDLGPLRPPVG